MKKIHYVSLLASLLFLSSTYLHAEMFKWTDKSGEVHYTQTPPPPDTSGKDIEADIRLSTGKLGNVIPQASKKPADGMEEARDEGKKSEEKHHDFCKQQQDALKQLTANSLVKWKDEKGEHYLTAAEKEEKKQQLEKNLQDMCRPEMFTNPHADQSQSVNLVKKDESTGGVKLGSTNGGSSEGNSDATPGDTSTAAGAAAFPSAN